MAIELPFGAKLEAPDVIYSKDLAYNLIGTGVLNKLGVTTIFHDGNIILVEADSFQLPKICKVMACNLGLRSSTSCLIDQRESVRFKSSLRR